MSQPYVRIPQGRGIICTSPRPRKHTTLTQTLREQQAAAGCSRQAGSGSSRWDATAYSPTHTLSSASARRGLTQSGGKSMARQLARLRRNLHAGFRLRGWGSGRGVGVRAEHHAEGSGLWAAGGASVHRAWLHAEGLGFRGLGECRGGRREGPCLPACRIQRL